MTEYAPQVNVQVICALKIHKVRFLSLLNVYSFFSPFSSLSQTHARTHKRACATCRTGLMRVVCCGGWLGRHRSRCLQPLQICLAFVHYIAINNTGTGGREAKVTHSAWHTHTNPEVSTHIQTLIHTHKHRYNCT